MPVQDLDRAIHFYAAVLGTPIQKQQYSGMAFGELLHSDGAVSGCLTPNCEGSDNKPSSHGPLLYLELRGPIGRSIAAVASSGGKMLQPRHQIGRYGFRAVVVDGEDNRIALYSM